MSIPISQFIPPKDGKLKYSSACVTFFSKIEISIINLIRLKSVFPGSLSFE